MDVAGNEDLSLPHLKFRHLAEYGPLLVCLHALGSRRREWREETAPQSLSTPTSLCDDEQPTINAIGRCLLLQDLLISLLERVTCFIGARADRDQRAEDAPIKTVVVERGRPHELLRVHGAHSVLKSHECGPSVSRDCARSTARERSQAPSPLASCTPARLAAEPVRRVLEGNDVSGPVVLAT